MCGITGSYNGVREELNALSHRGPDAHGSYEVGEFRLSHFRLSIVDVGDRSNQPFQGNRYVISFNGEIYNHEYLRNIYASLGYKFTTQSDTEVILAGLELLGYESFESLDGMFALAVYDKTNSSFLFCRDKLGIKPLYYYESKNKLLFASEVCAFNIGELSLSTTARCLFWTFGFVPEPYTHFNEIKSFQPGRVYSYDQKELRVIYEFGDHCNHFKSNLDLKSLFVRNLKNIKANEVNNAIALSGGLDSMLITKLMSESFEKSEVNVLGLYTKGKSFSEEENQRKIAQYYNVNSDFVDTSSLAEDSFQGYLDAMDVPSLDGYNVYELSKEAKLRGIKVLYSGLGADELFFGYEKFRLMSIYYRCPQFILDMSRHFIRRFRWKCSNKVLESYVVLRSLNDPQTVSRICNIAVSDVLKIVSDTMDLYARHSKSGLALSLSELDLAFYTRSQLLRDGDVFAMKNSVEIRFPFLQRDIVEYSRSLSSRGLQDVNSYKLHLRNLLNKTECEFIYQKKKGFHISPLNILDKQFELMRMVDNKFFK